MSTFTRIAFAIVVIAAIIAIPGVAQAVQTCGSSSGHTICITVSSTTLSGNAQVTVTNSPNNGALFYRWTPASTFLMEQDGPNADTGTYSFVWPTNKYLDATGNLEIRAESKTATPVVLGGLRLSNGNTTDFQHTPSDWQSYLPGPWTQSGDATIMAVGDGPDGLATAKSVAGMIDAASPPLFLFLGDIYDKGSFTENLNHYGVSSMDVPGGGTLWGAFADVTQPTLGNHEAGFVADWTDYFHGRPTFMAFSFGGVLFIDLDSNASQAVGSAQYAFVQGLLASAPPCVVAFQHHPTFKNDADEPGLTPMWQLLANNGGDLLLVGHTHTMSEYVPLTPAGQPGGHMVQLIAGSGGHSLGSTQRGTRIAWSQGGTAGALSLTLNGSANGGTANGMAWAYKNTSGSVLRGGSVACVSGSSGPAVFGFNPTSGPPGTPVGISGSGFTGATDVTFGGVSAGAGNFTVNSGSSINATVPGGALTGPVCVKVGAATGCSSSNFTVGSPGSIQRVRQIGTAVNTSGVVQNTLSVTVPVAIPSGDTVVLGVGVQNAVDVVAVSDSRGNSYVVDSSHQSAGSGKSTTAVISGRVTTALLAGDTISVTVSKGNAWGFVAEQWSGLSFSDQDGGADSGGAKSSSVSVSTAGATGFSPEVVFVVTVANGAIGMTPGPGFTETADVTIQNTSTRSLGFQFAVISSTGTQTGSATLSKSAYWAASIATYA